MTLETVSCEALELPKPEASGKAAPSAVHLMPLGAFRARDGRDWTLFRPERVIARFKAAKIDLPIDYEHQSNEAARAKITGPIPAAGWITDLELRPDGIWGQVKWTDTAARLIRDREYRFISPTFAFNTATKEVEQLKGAGLVHTPALHLTALAREEPTMTPETVLAQISEALGLPVETDVADVLSAVKKLATPDPAKYVPIEAVKDLLKDRGERAEMARESDVEATVAKALDGGYITPGMRDWATDLCRSDPQSFADFMRSTAPAYASLFTSPFDGKTIATDRPRSFDEAELAICSQLGIEPGTLVKD